MLILLLVINIISCVIVAYVIYITLRPMLFGAIYFNKKPRICGAFLSVLSAAHS
jgi:hypothetical protein